eukprot:Seg3507.2 transcript_id=Seg3507.2/GoldUCD/mRNA.D3Y31 product="hypothetical protein" protein_id=Seg3507.2/GoldUCD/D3Y31
MSHEKEQQIPDQLPSTSGQVNVSQIFVANSPTKIADSPEKLCLKEGENHISYTADSMSHEEDQELPDQMPCTSRHQGIQNEGIEIAELTNSYAMISQLVIENSPTKVDESGERFLMEEDENVTNHPVKLFLCEKENYCTLKNLLPVGLPKLDACERSQHCFVQSENTQLNQAVGDIKEVDTEPNIVTSTENDVQTSSLFSEVIGHRSNPLALSQKKAHDEVANEVNKLCNVLLSDTMPSRKSQEHFVAQKEIKQNKDAINAIEHVSTKSAERCDQKELSHMEVGKGKSLEDPKSYATASESGCCEALTVVNRPYAFPPLLQRKYENKPSVLNNISSLNDLNMEGAKDFHIPIRSQQTKHTNVPGPPPLGPQQSRSRLDTRPATQQPGSWLEARPPPLGPQQPGSRFDTRPATQQPGSWLEARPPPLGPQQPRSRFDTRPATQQPGSWLEARPPPVCPRQPRSWFDTRLAPQQIGSWLETRPPPPVYDTTNVRYNRQCLGQRPGWNCYWPSYQGQINPVQQRLQGNYNQSQVKYGQETYPAFMPPGNNYRAARRFAFHPQYPGEVEAWKLTHPSGNMQPLHPFQNQRGDREIHGVDAARDEYMHGDSTQYPLGTGAQRLNWHERVPVDNAQYLKKNTVLAERRKSEDDYFIKRTKTSLKLQNNGDTKKRSSVDESHSYEPPSHVKLIKNNIPIKSKDVFSDIDIQRALKCISTTELENSILQKDSLCCDTTCTLEASCAKQSTVQMTFSPVSSLVEETVSDIGIRQSLQDSIAEIKCLMNDSVGKEEGGLHWEHDHAIHRDPRKPNNSIGETLGDPKKLMKSIGEMLGDPKKPINSVGETLGDPKKPMDSVGEMLDDAKKSMDSVGEVLGDPKKPMKSIGEMLGDPKKPIYSVGETLGHPKKPMKSIGEMLGDPKKPINSVGETLDDPKKPMNSVGEMLDDPKKPMNSVGEMLGDPKKPIYSVGETLAD